MSDQDDDFREPTEQERAWILQWPEHPRMTIVKRVMEGRHCGPLEATYLVDSWMLKLLRGI